MKSFEDMLLDLILTGEIREEVKDKDPGFFSGFFSGFLSGLDWPTCGVYATIVSALITFTFFAFKRELVFLRQPRPRQAVGNDTSRILDMTSHTDLVKTKAFKGLQRFHHLKYGGHHEYGKAFSLPTHVRIQRNASMQRDSKQIRCIRDPPIVLHKAKNGAKEAPVISGNRPYRTNAEAKTYSESSQTHSQEKPAGVADPDKNATTGMSSKFDATKPRQTRNEPENTTITYERKIFVADQKQALHFDSSGTFQEKSEDKMELADKMYPTEERVYRRLGRDNSSCDEKDSLSTAVSRSAMQRNVLHKSHSLSSVEFIKEIYHKKKLADDFFRNDAVYQTQNISPMDLHFYMSRLLAEGIPESYTTYRERRMRSVNRNKQENSVYSLVEQERCSTHYRSMGSSRTATGRTNQSGGSRSLIPVLRKRAGNSSRNSASSYENQDGPAALKNPQGYGKTRGASAACRDENKFRADGKRGAGQTTGTTQTDPTCRRFATSGYGSPAKLTRNSAGRVSNRKHQRGVNTKLSLNNPEEHGTYNVSTKRPEPREPHARDRRGRTTLEDSGVKPQSDLSTTSLGSIIVSNIVDSLMDVQNINARQKSRHSRRRRLTAKRSSEFGGSVLKSQMKRISRRSDKDDAQYNHPIYLPYDYLRSIAKVQKCGLHDFSTNKNPTEQKETALACGIETSRKSNRIDLQETQKTSLTKNCPAVPIGRLCKPSTVASSFSGCSSDSVFGAVDSEEGPDTKASPRKPVAQNREPTPTLRQNYQNKLNQSASTEAVVRRLEGIQKHAGNREAQKSGSDSMASERRRHDNYKENVYILKCSSDNDSCDVDLGRMDNPVSSYSTSDIENEADESNVMTEKFVNLPAMKKKTLTRKHHILPPRRKQSALSWKNQSAISPDDMLEAVRVEKEMRPSRCDTTPSPPGSYRKVNSGSYEKSSGRKSRIPLPLRSLQKSSERTTPNRSVDNESPKLAGYLRRDTTRQPVMLSAVQKEGHSDWPLITIDKNIPQIRRRKSRLWGLKGHEDKGRSLVHVNLLSHKKRYASDNRRIKEQRNLAHEEAAGSYKASDVTTRADGDSDDSQSCGDSKRESSVGAMKTEERPIPDVAPALNDSITDFKVSTSEDDNTETQKMRLENIKQWTLTLIPQVKPERKWIPSLGRKYPRVHPTASTSHRPNPQCAVTQARVGASENRLNLKHDARNEVGKPAPVETQPQGAHLVSADSSGSGQGDGDKRVYETRVQQIEVDLSLPEDNQKPKEAAAACVPANPTTAGPKEMPRGKCAHDNKRGSPIKFSSSKPVNKYFERKMASLILAKQISPNEKSGNSSQSYQLEQGFSPLMQALMAFKKFKFKPIFQCASETPNIKNFTHSKPTSRFRESEEDLSSQRDNFPITCVTYKDYYSRSDYMSSAGSQIVSTNTLRCTAESKSLDQKCDTVKTHSDGRSLRPDETPETAATASPHGSISLATAKKRTGPMIASANKSISEKPHDKASSGRLAHAHSEWFRRSKNKDGAPAPSFQLTFKSRYQRVQPASVDDGDPRQEIPASQSRHVQYSKQLNSPYKQADTIHGRDASSPKNESWIYKVINVPSRATMRFGIHREGQGLHDYKRHISQAAHNPLRLCNKNAESKKTGFAQKTSILPSSNKFGFSKQLSNQVHVFHSPSNPPDLFKKPNLSSPNTDVHLVNDKNVTSPNHRPYGIRHRQIISPYSQCMLQRPNAHFSNTEAKDSTAREGINSRAKCVSQKADMKALNASVDSQPKIPNETTILKEILHFGIKKPLSDRDSDCENEGHRKSLTKGERQLVHGINCAASTNATLMKDLRPGCKTILSSKQLFDKTENKKVGLPQVLPVSRESSQGDTPSEYSTPARSYRKSRARKQLASVRSRAVVKVDESSKALKGAGRVLQARIKPTKRDSRESLSVRTESVAHRLLITPNSEIYGKDKERNLKNSQDDLSALTEIDMSTTDSSHMTTPKHRLPPEPVSTSQPAKDKVTSGSLKGKTTQPKPSDWKGRATPASPCPTPTARHHLGNIDELREKYLKEMKSKYLYRQLPLDISPAGCCKSIIDHYQYEMMTLNRGNYFHNGGSKRKQRQPRVKEERKVRTRDSRSPSPSQVSEKNVRPCSRFADSCSLSETQKRASRNIAFKPKIPSHIWKLFSIQEYDELSRHSGLVPEINEPTNEDKSQTTPKDVRREPAAKIIANDQSEEERVTPLKSDRIRSGTPVSTPEDVSGAKSKVSMLQGGTGETEVQISQYGCSPSQSQINTDFSRMANTTRKCVQSVEETIAEVKPSHHQTTNSSSTRQIKKKRSVQISDNLDIQPLTKMRREHRVVREKETSDTSSGTAHLSGAGHLEVVQSSTISPVHLTPPGHGEPVDPKKEMTSLRDCWEHQDDIKVGDSKLLDSHKRFSNQINLVKKRSKLRVVFKRSPTINEKNAPCQRSHGPMPLLTQEKTNQPRCSAVKPEPYRNDFSRAFAVNTQQPCIPKGISERSHYGRKSVVGSPKISHDQANQQVSQQNPNKKPHKELGSFTGLLDIRNQTSPKASPPRTNLYLRTSGNIGVPAKEHLLGEFEPMSHDHGSGANGQGVRKGSCIRFRGTKNKKYVTSALLYTKKKLGFSAEEQNPTSYRRPALGENNSAHRGIWDTGVRVGITDNDIRLSGNDASNFDGCFSEQKSFAKSKGEDKTRWTNNEYPSTEKSISAPPNDTTKQFDQVVAPISRDQNLSASCCTDTREKSDATQNGETHLVGSAKEMVEGVVLEKTSPQTASVSCSLKQDGASDGLQQQPASDGQNNLNGASSQSVESACTQISFDWYKPSASSTGRVTETAYRATQNALFRQVADSKNNSAVWARIATGLPKDHANTSLYESNAHGHRSKENDLQPSSGPPENVTYSFKGADASSGNCDRCQKNGGHEGDRKRRIVSAADSSQSSPTREMTAENYNNIERGAQRSPNQPPQFGEFQEEAAGRTGLTNLSTLYRTLQHTYNKANQAFHANWILANNYHDIPPGQSPQLNSGATVHKCQDNYTQAMHVIQGEPRHMNANPCRFRVGVLEYVDGETNQAFQQVNSGQTNPSREDCQQTHWDPKGFPASHTTLVCSGPAVSTCPDTANCLSSVHKIGQELVAAHHHPLMSVSYFTGKPVGSREMLTRKQEESHLTTLPESDLQRSQTVSEF